MGELSVFLGGMEELSVLRVVLGWYSIEGGMGWYSLALFPPPQEVD